MWFVLALAATSLPAAGPARARIAADPVTWAIDTVHSEVSFRIRHLVSRVPGTFTSWRGTITADPANLQGGTVDVRIATASITTKNERRDAHLVLTGEFGGVTGSPEPRKQRIGFSVGTKINRLDYGVKYNRAVEGGGMLLGDDVDITINIEAVRQ